jgi:hypothetical protein
MTGSVSRNDRKGQQEHQEGSVGVTKGAIRVTGRVSRSGKKGHRRVSWDDGDYSNANTK